MKKYNISNLYVVEVKNANNTHYLICKHKKLSDIYVEIFTNEKIKATKDLNVAPFSKYYSAIGQLGYVNEKFIDEKELLRKYATLNDKTILEKVEEPFQSSNNTIESKGILESATLNFFPKEGEWSSACFEQSEDLEMTYLPCHLRDDLWLAQMLKKHQKLFHTSTSRILQFVKTSSFFQEKRHEYEQEIIKWQIDWMKNGGEGWIGDKDFGEDFAFLTPTCDLGFRKGVVDTLSKIGMSIDAIEEGIEKNADRWRDLFMDIAFTNEYEPIIIYSNKEYPLEPADPEFRKEWLRMRKYEYYKRHKDSVDKYGIVEPDMILPDDEVKKLKGYLEKKHDERKEQISEYREEKIGNKRKQKKLRKKVN